MGTWIKETDQAVYLMEGNNYIDRVLKEPSTSNPKEKVANVEALKAWFTRQDKPGMMTISVGTNAPEPDPIPDKPGSILPPNGGGGGSHTGVQLRVIADTFFKLAPKLSSELTDQEKVRVKSGTVFDIEYYTDVGSNHWLIELVAPTIGDKQTTAWYVYVPDTELISGVTLTVISDTLFKLEPKLSIDLPDTSKVFVKNGSQFQLLSYEPAAGNHTKIELADATLGNNPETVWYAYTPDIKIQGQRQTLQVVSDTLFKTQPVQSSELADSEKVFVKNKTVFLVNSYAQPEGMHVRLALEGASLGPQGRNTWYCFVPDIMISGTEIGNQPDDNNSSSGQPTEPSDRGIPLQFPGFDGVYYSNDPIYWETQDGERGYFTWGEAVHANPATGYYRHPTSADIVYGILRVASVMEDIRKRYGGKPIQVNSWYRDPATNAAVGGASQSRHMSGDAVDFVVPGVHPYDVYADLDGWWGSRGGLASSTLFTHIDVRGYRARWDYGY